VTASVIYTGYQAPIFKQNYSFTKLPNETLSETLAIYSPLPLTTQR